ncbi:MAG: secretion system protein F [Gammaproteobacteria bacterium RIFCSPLOWO2_02_FULL_61_13]|nr:MAG: secretion system protein F [Gammaproteobacteria bacterium RIFCSPLOWO2_02_FULL_61_13]
MVVLEKGQDFLDGYRETFTSTASSNMSDMFLFLDPQKLFKYNLIAIVVLPLISWILFRDIGATLAVLGIVIILPASVYRSMRARRMKKFEAQLPDALLMVSGAMRAGASLSIALEGLVKEQPPPISQEFELYLKEQRLGVEFEQSLRSMEARNPMPDFRMLVTALRINREVGGNLAETMETLGDTLRRKSMMEGKIESLTAQGKLQGIVMTGLPILLGCLLNFMEPEAMSKLWTTPIGWALLVVIVIMESMGYFLIKKITTIDV